MKASTARTFSAVLYREWIEWRMLVLGAFVAGWLPLVVPWIQGLRADEADNFRQAACFLILVLFVLGAVPFLGSGLLARDLHGGRLPFYLARPLDLRVLWTGRLVAALGILPAAALLLMLPTLIADPSLVRSLLKPTADGPAAPLSAISEFFILNPSRHLPRALSMPTLSVAVLVALAGALLVSHWLHVAYRSKSTWLLLDAVAASMIGAGLWLLWSSLISHQAYGAMVWIERLWLPTVAGILWLAGRRQLERARLDPVRGHGVFSVFAWAGLAGLLLLSAAYGRFILSGSSEDLVDLLAVSPSPNGEHVLIGGTLGERAGRQAAFLVSLDDPEQESSVGSLVPAMAYWRWSGDGSRAIWPQCRRIVPTECEIWTRHLEIDPEPRPTGIRVLGFQHRLAIAHDGSRIAVGHGLGAEVYRADDGSLVTAFKTERVLALSFLDPGRLRIQHHPPDDIAYQVVRVLDVEERTSKVVGQVPDDAFGRSYAHSADGRWIFFNSLMPRRYEIRDAITGEVKTDLSALLGLDSESVGLSDARFMDDGRLVMLLVRRQPARELELVIADPPAPGTEELAIRRRRLPEAGTVRIGPTLETGAVTLIVEDAPFPASEADPILAAAGLEPLRSVSTYLLHADDDESVLHARGYAPVPFHHNHALHQPRRGVLFLAGKRALFTLENGEAKVIFPGVPDAPETLHFQM